MKCPWEQVLSLLPGHLSREADSLGKGSAQELRLRVGTSPELNFGTEQQYLKTVVCQEDIAYVINAASRYSPWQAESIARGFLTAPGGHRIGICGEAIFQGGNVQGIRNPDSLCIRIARDLRGHGMAFQKMRSSLLLLGPPGSGKTTLLRDIARTIAEQDTVIVVDEREELFPPGFQRGRRMDVLRSFPKEEGIDIALRTMGPDWIVVDEITREEDCEAILKAANCGVRLMATAHGSGISDLNRRMLYQKLLNQEVFPNIVVLQKDKSYVWERKEAWI